MYVRHIIAAICLVLGCADVMTLAVAPTLVYSANGFESPFVPGSLTNQSNWDKSGVAGTTATVQNSVSKSGQAVRINRATAANADAYWFRTVDVLNVAAGQDVIHVDFDLLYQPGAGNEDFGHFGGVDSFDIVGSTVKELGGAGVDVKTGQILYLVSEAEGGFGEDDTFLAANTWNHFTIAYDFGVDAYTVFVNGSHIATAAFPDIALNPQNFSDASLASIRGTEEITPTGTVFFDNYVITRGGLVPEPANLVWIGLLGLMLRRTRGPTIAATPLRQ